MYPIVRIEPTTQGRERSTALWRNALDKYAADPQLGILYEEDFTKPHVGVIATTTDGWCFTEDGVAGATSELFYTTGAAGGVASLAATAGADYRGVKIQAGSLIAGATGEGITLPTATTDSKSECIFECRVKLDISAGGNDTLFAGLAEHTATVKTLGAASALPDDSDYIGFYRVDAGDLQFVVRNDNAGGTAVEYNVDVLAAATIAASYEDAWVKLGFRVNADSSVEIYIDGAKVTKETAGSTKIAVTTTSLPEEALCRTVSVGRGATADNATVGVLIDRIDCYVSE